MTEIKEQLSQLNKMSKKCPIKVKLFITKLLFLLVSLIAHLGHYLPPSREVEISKAGINAIESALSQKNIPYWEVKTWTTDGFYRETVEMVQYRKEEGCQVVEMECSALAACAKFRKVTWAMLLFSADTLADPHKYQEREWGKTSISIALELALDAVLSVVEE